MSTQKSIIRKNILFSKNVMKKYLSDEEELNNDSMSFWMHVGKTDGLEHVTTSAVFGAEIGNEYLIFFCIQYFFELNDHSNFFSFI